MRETANDPEVCAEYFNKIYDETFDSVKVYVASRCADPSYIPDILQETYCELYKLLLKHGVGYADNAQSLLYKIAKRRIFRYYSLRKKLSFLVPMFGTNSEGDEYCVVDDEYVQIEDEIIDKLESDRIWEIINTYPAETRKILYLYFSCGMPHSQIANQLGRSISFVKNRIYRTLTEIREKENSDERKQDK